MAEFIIPRNKGDKTITSGPTKFSQARAHSAVALFLEHEPPIDNHRESSGTVALTPQSSDVLLGRGKGLQKHMGNLRFRAIVNHFLFSYFCAADRKEKGAIKTEIVNIVLKSGRFLRKENGQWTAVSKEMARVKVAQSLLYEWRQHDNSMVSFRSEDFESNSELVTFATDSSNDAAPESEGSDEDLQDILIMEIQADPNDEVETASQFALGFDPASREVIDVTAHCDRGLLSSTVTTEAAALTKVTRTLQGLLVIGNEDSFYDNNHFQNPENNGGVETVSEKIEFEDLLMSESMDHTTDALNDEDEDSFLWSTESSDDTQSLQSFRSPDFVFPSPGPDDDF